MHAHHPLPGRPAVNLLSSLWHGLSCALPCRTGDSRCQTPLSPGSRDRAILRWRASGPPSFRHSLNASDHKCHTQCAMVDCENEIGRRQPWRWGGLTAETKMNASIQNYLSSLRLGEPQTHRNIVVVPLIGSSFGTSRWLTLGEALEQQLLS